MQRGRQLTSAASAPLARAAAAAARALLRQRTLASARAEIVTADRAAASCCVWKGEGRRGRLDWGMGGGLGE